MARTILDALHEGTNRDQLGCAAHEVGHGVVHHLAGIPIREMRIWPQRQGWAGVCTPAVTRITDEQVPCYQVGLMAGAAAAYRFLTRYTDLGPRRAREVAEAGAHHDLPDFDRLHRQHRDGASIGLPEARRLAAALVDRHGRRIDQLTLTLATRHHLPGRAL